MKTYSRMKEQLIRVRAMPVETAALLQEALRAAFWVAWAEARVAVRPVARAEAQAGVAAPAEIAWAVEGFIYSIIPAVFLGHHSKELPVRFTFSLIAAVIFQVLPNMGQTVLLQLEPTLVTVIILKATDTHALIHTIFNITRMGTVVGNKCVRINNHTEEENMSIFAKGSFNILKANEPAVNYLRDFSFIIQNVANKERIGLSFVIENSLVQNSLNSDGANLYFELSDSPFEHTADNLFGNDGCNELDENGDVLASDPGLPIRIKKVKTLFDAVFEFEFIAGIVLQIDSWTTDLFMTREISLDQFEKALLADYSENHVFPPSLQYTITKSSGE